MDDPRGRPEVVTETGALSKPPCSGPCKHDEPDASGPEALELANGGHVPREDIVPSDRWEEWNRRPVREDGRRTITKPDTIIGEGERGPRWDELPHPCQRL